MIKVDLHVHTSYSADSLTLLPFVERSARRRGLHAVAITDHNSIQGALRLQRESALQIIVGEEIRTSQGEVIGLFLEAHIPPGLAPRETVRLIREQNGVVCIPHPVDRLRGSALEPTALQEILEEVDALEVLNARNTFGTDNRLARALAEQHHLLATAGSDAHHPSEIGRAYVEMPAFVDRDGFLASLAQGQVRGHLSPPYVHVASTYAKVAKNVRAQGILSHWST